MYLYLHEGKWRWRWFCRACPVLQKNSDSVYKGAWEAKGSCFWLVGRYETCLQCLCKLVSSTVRDGLWFATFLLFQARVCVLPMQDCTSPILCCTLFPWFLELVDLILPQRYGPMHQGSCFYIKWSLSKNGIVTFSI